MSASNNIGSLQAYGGVQVRFATAAINGGRVSERTQTVLEELVANGVDGRRWRRRFQQYMPFKMSTLSDGASWGAGQLDANAYEDLVGNFGTLTLTISNITKTWKNVKVLTCEPKLQAGRLVGANADPASAYVLAGEWTLVLTEAAK